MIKSTIAPLAVFGILLASFCNAKLDIKPNDRERILKSNLPTRRFDRSYIKTHDGKRELRREEPVSVVTTTAPNGRTLQEVSGTVRCRLWQTCITFEEDGARRDSETWECSYDDPGINQSYEGYSQKEVVATGGRNLNSFLEFNGAVSGGSVLVVSEALLTEDQMIIEPGDIEGIEDYDYIEPNSNRDGDTRPDRVVGGADGQAAEPKPLKGLEAFEETIGQERRRLATPTGSKTTLVVRINASDNEFGASAKDLSDDIFNDPYCLKSQYASCSYNQLQIQEYIPGQTPTLSPTNLQTVPGAPGVVNIDIAIPATGADRKDIQNEATAKLTTLLGTSPGNVFDLVMFCMPPGSGNWIAYAVINRWDSYYNNDWCQSVSSQMHEVGHNIGLHHSGEYTGSSSVQEYGDQSDMMGYSYRSDDTPAMCFNPAKSFQLGWYEDKQISLDPNTELSTEPQSYILNGVVDYEDNTPGRYVVIRINQFYIGFNRATSFNTGVLEAANQVTVIEKLGEPSESVMSKLASKLSIGGEYVFELSELLSVKVVYESNDNGRDAVISLSLIGDVLSCAGEFDAEVEIVFVTDNYPAENSLGIADPTGVTTYFNDDFPTPGTYTLTVGNICRGLEYTFFINDSYGDGICCSWGQGSFAVRYKGEDLITGAQFTNQQLIKFIVPEDETAAPVPSPTFGPTSSPTESPTAGPTSGPTSSPTKSPTAGPTSGPTSSPTAGPTSGPTSSPTEGPTAGPTSSPTSSPTEGPTAGPTASPNSSPTSSPTTSPTGGPTDEPTTSPISSPTTSPTGGPTDEPTTSPISSPTSSPTGGPTGEPTTSPISSPTSGPTSSPTKGPTELVGCVDDPNWLYRGKPKKGCAWVAKGNDKNTRIKCLRRAAKDKKIKTKVYAYCKETCDKAGIKKAC